MKGSKSELAWKLADYLEAGVPPPELIVQYPQSCEGELMTKEEVEDWMALSLKTLIVVREEDPELFEDLCAGFRQDVEFLLGLGRLPDEARDLINNPDNFKL